MAGFDQPGEQVSIPERVWGGLEPLGISGVNSGPVVSIPERVWGGLERWEFKMARFNELVSIPERVWGGLELHPRGTASCPSPRFNP